MFFNECDDLSIIDKFSSSNITDIADFDNMTRYFCEEVDDFQYNENCEKVSCHVMLYLNNNYKNVYINEDISMYNFPLIFINSIIEQDIKFNYRFYTKFLQKLYSLRKSHINIKKYLCYVYGMVNNKRFSLKSIPNFHDVVVTYSKGKMLNFINMNKIDFGKIIYIDTDQIFYLGEGEYTKKYTGGVFFNKKKYILNKGNDNFLTRGRLTFTTNEFNI